MLVRIIGPAFAIECRRREICENNHFLEKKHDYEKY